MVQPVGGHKGYGMSLMVAALAAALPGAAMGDEVGDLHGDFEHVQDVGHFAQAIDVSRITDLDAYRARVDALIDDMHRTPLASGATEILVPGEREHRNETWTSVHGIEYPAAVLDELVVLGIEVGVGPIPLTDG